MATVLVDLPRTLTKGWCMPFPAHVVQVLIASPGDVREERTALREAMWAWNDEHAAALGVVLLPIGWETHSRPELGGHPQHLIDRQVAEGADVLVGVFWTRLGTPTPEAESGTVHEVQSFHEAGKPVLLYFSDAPAVLTNVDLNQVEAVRNFRTKAGGWGLVGRYDSVDELVQQARTALLRLVRERFDLPTSTISTSAAGGPRVLAEVVSERREKGLDKRNKMQYSTHHYLTITNVGTAPARSVKLRWDADDEGPLIHDMEQGIAHLPAGASVRLPMLLTMSSPSSGTLHITWEDDRGAQHEERQTVRA